MSENIECRVVVIRGASDGLGEATAGILSAQGASDVDVNKILLRPTRKELYAEGSKSKGHSTQE
jgi:NAD(P)-dependent dehydrogenase (short-subunit alcohol dehydrogenase family)